MTDRATVRDGAIHIERLLPGPIERVWSYIVDPDKRALWFAGGAFEQKAGGKGEFVFDHRNLSHEPTPEAWKAMEGFRSPMWVVRIEPPRLLVLGWTEGERSSELTFKLSAQGDKVLLVLRQSPVATPEDLSNYGVGWHTHLDTLQDRLEGKKPRGFWSNFDRLQKVYSSVQDA
jgi:uncharacterized protein YndB with AHSA1/START domain